MTLMDQEKLQRLHDTLSKLRKSAGLGTASQYSWVATTITDEDGEVVRNDGLPNNVLYSNFLKEGTFDPAGRASDGDGRFIKRDFDDVPPTPPPLSEDPSIPSRISSADSEARRKRKKRRKDQKKAERKAMKLEIKRRAKLEEKKEAKKEAKRLARQASTISESSCGAAYIEKHEGTDKDLLPYGGTTTTERSSWQHRQSDKSHDQKESRPSNELVGGTCPEKERKKHKKKKEKGRKQKEN